MARRSSMPVFFVGGKFSLSKCGSKASLINAFTLHMLRILGLIDRNDRKKLVLNPVVTVVNRNTATPKRYVMQGARS